MKIRCSLYNPGVLFAFLAILIFYRPHAATAQCHGDFSFRTFPADDKSSSSGRIEVSVKSHAPGIFTFKVYRMEGKITLVETKDTSSPDKIIFEGLIPSTYFIKVKWGEACNKTLGGLEGIIITEKDQ